MSDPVIADPMYYRVMPHEFVLVIASGLFAGSLGTLVGVVVGLGWYLAAIALAAVVLALFGVIEALTRRVVRRTIEHELRAAARPTDESPVD